jgi:hypothetical protein
MYKVPSQATLRELTDVSLFARPMSGVLVGAVVEYKIVAVSIMPMSGVLLRD